MMANMSALPTSSTVSTESPTGMPASRNAVVGGKPKPMRSSEVGARLIDEPAAFMAAISSAVA